MRGVIVMCKGLVDELLRRYDRNDMCSDNEIDGAGGVDREG